MRRRELLGGADAANGYEYVDLGLSVKWAKLNVGAKSITDIGNYYRWGESNPSAPCGYEYYSDELLTSEKDYILPLTADTAHVVMGGDWRMPTNEEALEMTTNTKTAQNYYIDGYEGRKRINKNNTNEDNYIFFRLSGWYGNSCKLTAQSTCYGWTSSSHATYYAKGFYISGTAGTTEYSKDHKLIVRGVIEV